VFTIAPFVGPHAERLFFIRLVVKFIAKTGVWRFDKNGFATIQPSAPDHFTIVALPLQIIYFDVDISDGLEVTCAFF